MFRGPAVLLLILFVCLYAQRNWFISLCIVIAFTAVQDYPGMPNPLQARGVNHWSVMLLGTALGWLTWRVGVRPRSNIPTGWIIVLSLYFIAEGVAITRLCLNLEDFCETARLVNPGYTHYTVLYILIDNVYGPIRYLLMAMLLMDGIRTRKQAMQAGLAISAGIVLYALVIHKAIPLSGLVSGGMEFRHRVHKWTGRDPNDLAANFAAALWILLSFWLLRLGSRSWRLGALALTPVIATALLHTYSRTGIVACVATGVATVAVLKSFRLFVILGLSVAATGIFCPGITDRVFAGFDFTGLSGHDIGEVTAGRDVIWPAAIQAIEEAPIVGYGRFGYVMSGATTKSMLAGGGELHPHNGFLEIALDGGLFGAVASLGPFLYTLMAGLALSIRRTDPLLKWIGVIGISATVSTLVAGIGGQHFILCENLWVFWCIATLTVAATRLPDGMQLHESRQVQAVRANAHSQTFHRRALTGHVRPRVES